MSSAPTDCRVPDPTDAKADGAFGGTHRAGYGGRLDRIIATARKGWTLAAGEGLVLVQEIDRLREELAQQSITLSAEHQRAERILAALRNPSDLMVDALREQIYDLSCFDEALKAIRAAVAAAEQEVGA